MERKQNVQKSRPKAVKGAARATGSNARKGYAKYIPYIIVAAIAVVLLYLIYYLATNYFLTSFSTFKSNYLNSPKVAIVVTYGNATQLSYETPCYEGIVQVVQHARSVAKNWNTSTMGFFILNSTSCSYDTSLGYPINIKNSSASACIAAIRPEPAIFLNYSSANNTLITPYKLYVYGNANYMRSCGITADLG